MGILSSIQCGNRDVVFVNGFCRSKRSDGWLGMSLKRRTIHVVKATKPRLFCTAYLIRNAWQPEASQKAPGAVHFHR